MLKNYLSLIKFNHTIFALPFAIIGYFLAIEFTDHVFQWELLGLVVLCMVFARSAAMAFNRLVDQKYDSSNPRTANREIPTGKVSVRFALIYVILNSLAFIITTYFINNTCLVLSPVALLIILGYSYTKRFTFLSHLVLGIGLSLAPIGAYLAVAETFDLLPLLFSFSIMFWVAGFDIIYALIDAEFDNEHKLFSIPSSFGKKNALIISTIFHFICAGFIIGAGVYASFGLWYWTGSGIFIGLLFYQHFLVKPFDLTKVNIAFFTTNGVASAIFAIFVILDLYIS